MSKVVVAPTATTVERVEQEVVFVPSDRKRDLLAHGFAVIAFDHHIHVVLGDLSGEFVPIILVRNFNLEIF